MPASVTNMQPQALPTLTNKLSHTRGVLQLNNESSVDVALSVSTIIFRRAKASMSRHTDSFVFGGEDNE